MSVVLRTCLPRPKCLFQSLLGGLTFSILLVAGCGPSVPEGKTTPAPGPSGTATDSSGGTNAPLRFAKDQSTTAALDELCRKMFPGQDVKAVALIFVLPDCPIANSYAAEYSRLHASFGPRRIPVVVIQVDPDLTDEKVQSHAKEYQITAPVLLDHGQFWTKRTGATMTPEAVIYHRDGTMLYRGRIDDHYVGVGKPRAVTTKRDLRDALEAVASGQPVAKPWPAAVGCHIPDLE